MSRFIHRVAAAAATPLLVLATTGCEAVGSADEFLNGKDCSSGPVVYAITDVSDSTKVLRHPGGLYESGVRKLIAETARDCGELYAAPLVDGNAIGNTAGWTIEGKTFRTIRLGGNAELGAAAREKKANEVLGPKIRKLLTTKSTDGSDALGALRRVSLAADGTPGGRRKRLVVFFDGVLNLPGHYSLYKTPIDTPPRLKRFINRLMRGGEVPDLKGFDVYLAGLGVGVSNRETAKAVISFWERLIPLAGARLRFADASLRYP